MMRFQRRQRTTFSKQQLDALNAAFKQNHYPEAHFRDYLAKTTNLDPSRIQVWFQNQRAKDRKRRGLMGSDDMSPFERNSPSSTQRSRSQNHYQANILGNTTLTGTLNNHQEIYINRPRDFDEQPQASTTHICVFSSVTANEAALAVSQGKFENIVEYHRKKYSNHQSLASGSGMHTLSIPRHGNEQQAELSRPQQPTRAPFECSSSQLEQYVNF